jgi:tRNA U34 5-carboxymethylaminomethyl modifying enzyme MnmG/GidA
VNENTKHTWVVAATMTALSLIPAGVVTAVVVGARGADSAHTPAVTSPAAQTDDSSRSERLRASVTDQSNLDMTEQHHAMMEQMRTSVSATMTNLMNSDPMWKTMRSSAIIADLEEHEQDIDTMLARGG